MKKIVLTFGLISGAIAASLMFATVPFIDRFSWDYLTAIGYTTFVICFLMVFFGIRSYRENVGGGTITFGRAFKVGILITLVSCLIYVISWEFIYHNFMSDFPEKYSAHLVETQRAAGATQEQLNVLVQQNQKFMELYKNPFIRFAMTMMEAFPVGLLMTLISAWILKRKPSQAAGPTADTAGARAAG